MGLGGVFNEMDIAAGGQRAERVEGAGAACDVDADNGDGFFGDGGFCRGLIDIIGIGVDFGEDGAAPGGDDGARAPPKA